jgi:hypothetical protein
MYHLKYLKKQQKEKKNIIEDINGEISKTNEINEKPNNEPSFDSLELNGNIRNHELGKLVKYLKSTIKEKEKYEKILEDNKKMMEEKDKRLEENKKFLEERRRL